jgi:hypothetical protein
MTTPREHDDAADDPIVSVPAKDPIAEAFAAAIGAVMDMLHDSFVRQTIVKEIIAAHERTKQALLRRYVN